MFEVFFVLGIVLSLVGLIAAYRWIGERWGYGKAFLFLLVLAKVSAAISRVNATR